MSKDSSRAGFTVVELLIALTVMTISLLGVVGTIAMIGRLGTSNAESTVAYQAARSMVETVQAAPFTETFALFNEDPADDPGGNGTAPGQHFAVPGLVPQEGDADGFVGRVLLPVSPDGVLRENLDDRRFGMPHDLNGDGDIDGDDRSGDYILLPVRVRVEWVDDSGGRFFEYSTMLGLR